MLYANDHELNGIFQALADIGLPETTIAIAREYLDLSKPMNNALLEGITAQDMSQLHSQYPKFSEKLAKFGEREIKEGKNDELQDRYTLLCNAIAGNTCCHMLYFPNGTNHYALHERALQRRYGKLAEVLMIAYEMERSNRAYWFITTKCNDIQVLAQALDHCIAEQPTAKLLICAHILSSAPLPDKKLLFKSKPCVQAQKAIACVEECWSQYAQFQRNDRFVRFLLLASAAGSCFSEEIAKQFHSHIQPKKRDVLDLAIRMPTQEAASRIASAIAANPCGDDAEFICYAAQYHFSKRADFGGVLAVLAQQYPENFRTALIRSTTNPPLAAMMENILQKENPTYFNPEQSVTKLAKVRCITALKKDYPEAEDAIVDFLCYDTELESLLPYAPKMSLSKWTYGRERVNYVAAFGMDDFAKRCLCVQVLAANGLTTNLDNTPGFSINGNEAEFVRIMRECGMPLVYTLRCAGEQIENAPTYNNADVEMREKFRTLFSENTDAVAACDLKILNVTARSLYLEILGKQPETYKPQILSLADDGSKVIRAELVEYLKQRPEWTQDVLAMLAAKKAAKRELALEVLAAGDCSAYKEALEAAYAAEKKADLKQKLGVLLGAECSVQTAESAVDMVADLTKGNKAKKLQWLFDTPFAPVHTKGGEEVKTAHLQAILLCYANMTTFSVSDMAKQLAEDLQEGELNAFALEVLSKWLESGAAAKQKWVLHAAAQHGGYEAQTTLLHYIKDWSEHSRGAIAAEAVHAIAYTGTPEALMAVDQMARKFKNRQVRGAAAAALAQAAQALHITTEELADRIVPNLGFDEQLCRVFDYGTRAFKVYLTPALELEIFEGEKKLKNLPKPGAKDDAELAESASKAFKEMKKQLKTVVTAQKQRLEYVLMCQRTWTAQGWQDLFVKNPVMHCFAMGLIWGTYDENGTLCDTFRYMEDGTFNTADEEEYELPETAVIGLVHPIELDDELRSAWVEQLEDYEITQPFAQLTRPVYRLAEGEAGCTELKRFVGRTMANTTLLSRMTKYGWDKGTPQDAGFFYEFTRSDVVRREQDENGNPRYIGNGAELKMSGMSVAYYETDDVTIEKIEFYRIGETKPIALETVNARYFSEILLQLNNALAVADVQEKE
ncbi:MAG: DUF4132 domain-containing protein [Ruminococcus sp.]|nr:DUF4132 domain-containing protein [Ruminococcus sp.]